MLIDWLIETDQKREYDFLLSTLRRNSSFPIVSLEIAAHPGENVSVAACSEVSDRIFFRSQLFPCLTCCQKEHTGLRRIGGLRCKGCP